MSKKTKTQNANMVLGHGECHAQLVSVQTGGQLWVPLRPALGKPELDLVSEPVILLLAACSQDPTSCCKDTCLSMLADALFTVARTWNRADVHHLMNG